jgi:5'-3' exonuclease
MSYRILILDGHSLARRTFEGSGEIAGAFLHRLGELREEHRPAICAVAWDRPDSAELRRAVHPSYKSKREPWPASFVAQLADLQLELAEEGVIQYTGPGEADDVIATVCRTMPGPVLIVSGDKDLLQLVGPGVHLLRGPRVVTAEEWAGLTPHGIPPGKPWLDYQTLAGDPVDGVPGLPRVGAVRAKSMLLAVPNLCDLLLADPPDLARARARVAAADPTQAKWVELAIRELELVRLTREMVRLRTIEIAAASPPGAVPEGGE